jgi:hypothetical protein
MPVRRALPILILRVVSAGSGMPSVSVHDASGRLR